MNKEEQIMLEKTKKFLKEAFCIDGECTHSGNTLNESITLHKHWHNEELHSLTFKLEDSNRGAFFVTLTSPENYKHLEQ